MQVTRRPARTPREAARRRDELDTLLDPALFAALSDPTRLRLVACIARCRRPCAVSEISACCAVDLSVVSRHLRVLADAGVLAPTREGRTVRYGVRGAELAARLRALADTLAAGGRDGCCNGGCRDGCC
ncbi:MAG: HTH-type transcriptional repressor SmtB [Planctomycetota bacterium]|jgi:ArsR family transcriptional regulator